MDFKVLEDEKDSMFKILMVVRKTGEAFTFQMRDFPTFELVLEVEVRSV